jgi:S-methylmethionine-dependent homocysteine/selenocysteine methylase
MESHQLPEIAPEDSVEQSAVVELPLRDQPIAGMPELITDLLRSAKSNKPYVVYPNSGRVWDAQNKVWTGSAAVGFSNDLIRQWVEAGAEIVGGCCGIGATEIEQLALSK